MKTKGRTLEVERPTRWRDRPAGGSSDEDRAAMLARRALASSAFPDGLDERQLARVEEGLMAASRVRPPSWLRPAIVAAFLIASAASAVGYETGWLAPLRGLLRFRSIPVAAPEPIAPERKPFPRAPTPGDRRPPPPSPSAGVAPATPARTARALPKNVAATIARKVALGEPPAPPPAVEHVEPTAAAEELQALEQAMSLLRAKHDAGAALKALDAYLARWPDGVLAPEARVARIDALLMLDRGDEALPALEALPLDTNRRSTELRLIRAELRARTDCGRAEGDFTAVLARVRTPGLEERALYGRAACRSARGESRGAAEDLGRYLARFPQGPHAAWARRWLENDR